MWIFLFRNQTRPEDQKTLRWTEKEKKKKPTDSAAREIERGRVMLEIAYSSSSYGQGYL